MLDTILLIALYVAITILIFVGTWVCFWELDKTQREQREREKDYFPATDYGDKDDKDDKVDL